MGGYIGRGQPVAAGGNSVETADIIDDAVTNAKIATNAVTGDNIASNAVGNSELSDNAVNTAEIAADAVDGTKIADNAIDSEHYASGSVSTTALANDAVTADKLANSINTAIAANTAKVTNATHTGDVTGSGALTIANDAVDSQHYAAGSIDNEHLAANSVDSDNYVDDSIDAAHLANSINTDIATGVTANTTANAALPKAGGTMTGDLLIGDSISARWGASNDLSISHDGAHSNIVDTGTGDLRIRADNLKLSRSSDAETFIYCTTDGDVKLYHNGAGPKLSTIATGVEVEGTAAIKYSVGSSTWNLTSTSGDDFTIDRNGTQRLIIDGSTGHVGIGVTPETYSGYTALQIGDRTMFGNYPNDSLICSHNAYSSGGWKYIEASYASRYEQASGAHRFQVAASGSADAAITWNTALTIANDGRGLSQFTAKAWCNFDGGGTPSFSDSHNCSTLGDWGTGNYGIYMTTGPNNTDYSVFCLVNDAKYGSLNTSNTAPQGGRFDIEVRTVDSNHSAEDVGYVNCLVFGD